MCINLCSVQCILHQVCLAIISISVIHYSPNKLLLYNILCKYVQKISHKVFAITAANIISHYLVKSPGSLYTVSQKSMWRYLFEHNSNINWSSLALFWRYGSFLSSWVTPPLFHQNFRVHPMYHVGVTSSTGLKLSGREIVFEEFQPIWPRYLNVADRRTDRQTDGQLFVA